ncbi:MAG: peptidoglycan bridge formation glycyltransferase FemA/FemB family protein [Treponema sp.]|jgi:lipid II:glycine glycyltransferase (peptidoglycan interpeptide bridge formation enzyme)|nr:peptidoglycan bridge formation glycyltransferase FemA/FemB family protein [Treponema sp.]
MAVPAAGSERVRWEYRGIAPADLACCDNAGSFLQSGFWGSFKARFGWNARPFLVAWEAPSASPLRVDLPLLVIHRPLAFGVSLAYVPWGPEPPWGSRESPLSPGDEAKTAMLRSLAEDLRALLPENTAFIRFDLPWHTEGADAAAPSLSAPFCRSAADVQSPDTTLVDLTAGEDAMLKRMKSKGRYNIRLAHKKGARVRGGGAEELERFYALYRETARRDGISIHALSYYEALFAHCAEYPGQELRLYFAEYEGRTLAAAIVLFRKGVATYLYGASSNEDRNVMAPYAVQWKAMTDAKAWGCAEYDLFGIPPGDDPDHPMAGLYRFKTSFGGRIIHRSGSWDFAYKRLARRLFSAAESLRKALRTMKKKRGRKTL